MAENHFHDFDFEEWTVSFEPVATKIEDLLLPTYRRILDTRQLDGTPQEKVDLGFFMAFQFLRTKAARNRQEPNVVADSPIPPLPEPDPDKGPPLPDDPPPMPFPNPGEPPTPIPL
jgi:hypothetical protein